ncbi:MAG: PEP-utilizing protein mobile subunit [Acidobacteria bacterium]|nr:PEP-utilizing protein mobile subunit [Acidobacteriota bacterium]
MSASEAAGFPNPFAVQTPPGAEGWEKLYPYYMLFSSERRQLEEGKFWFRDSMHHPEPLYPFDAITAESWGVALGEYNSRVFLFPAGLGIDQRILNGYLYVSPNAITDEAVIRARVAGFAERAGHYYQNWNDLYDRWIRKAEAAIADLKAIQIPEMPQIEELAVVLEGRGVTSAYRLIESYGRVLESMYKIWHYHFEMLNLGYAVYQTFFAHCKTVFPEIPDQNIARLVAGIDILLFRPDEELKRLARVAVELGVTSCLRGTSNPSEVLTGLRETEAGRRWLSALEESKEPWFNFSSGTGFCHVDRSWADDLSVPLASIRRYAELIEAGADIARPLDSIRRERERMADEYGALLPTDDDRKAFRDQLELARTVFPYIENHNFYVEHWHHSVFWNKMRDFGRLLAAGGFLKDTDDLFFLNRVEVGEALYDLILSWAAGSPARGPEYWPTKVEQRKAIFEALRRSPPPMALGQPPEVITDPVSIMLWGITTETVRGWLSPSRKGLGSTSLTGSPGSPGVVEGPARVLMSADQLVDALPGEILVCPITAPSWTPAFATVSAVVTDIGGIMSHAAIVCREYGLPAVVGTGRATTTFSTGQWLRVDGNRGTVAVVEPKPERSEGAPESPRGKE